MPSGDGDALEIWLDRSWFDNATREELGTGKCRKRLVDNEGRTWVVREIKDLGRSTPFWLAVLMTMMFQGGDVVHRAHYVLNERELTPFAQVQAEIVKLMEGDPDAWVDVHQIDGDLVTEETLLAPYKAAIMGATNLQELVTRLDAVWRD